MEKGKEIFSICAFLSYFYMRASGESSVLLCCIRYKVKKFICLVGDCMITKICDNCGKFLPVSKRCHCKPYKCRHEFFYDTYEWKKARAQCRKKCFELDLYSYFVLHRIEYGRIVHHIIPLEKDYSLRSSQDNLIYLTDSNHRLIHELYKNDFEKTVKILRGCLEMF